MSDCPQRVAIRVLGEPYPCRTLCGCGKHPNPSDDTLQREVEEWLYDKYARADVNNR